MDMLAIVACTTKRVTKLQRLNTHTLFHATFLLLVNEAWTEYKIYTTQHKLVFKVMMVEL